MKWLLLILLVLTIPVGAADIVIEWKDSVVIEDAYVRSNDATNNFGRVTTAGATRVVCDIGPFFSNERISIVRINTFKDSTDLHAGLIIDSLLFSFSIQAVTVSVGDTFFIQTSGIDTNKNWVEGDRNGAEAQDCEVARDSAQQIGSAGTCATAQEWLVTMLRGTADTMGIFTGKPADSVRMDDAVSAGDRILIYVDTVVGNIWKATADDNEGFCIRFTYKSGNISTALNWYGSETSVAGRADSIPTFTLYGSTPEVGVVSTRRRKVILGGQ